MRMSHDHDIMDVRAITPCNDHEVNHELYKRCQLKPYSIFLHYCVPVYIPKAKLKYAAITVK